MALESVLITSSIDSQKRMDVEVVDIPEAFLTANIDEDVIMVLQGIIAKIMVKP